MQCKQKTPNPAFFLILSSLLISFNAASETLVYVGNNTDYHIQVNTVNTLGGLGIQHWKNYSQTLSPRNGDFDKVNNPVANFNRNTGLGYGKAYEFDTSITIGNKPIVLTTRLVGCSWWPCSGSSISTRIKGPDNSYQSSFTDNYNTKKFTFRLENGKYIQAQYRQYNRGTGDDRIYLTLNQDLPENYTKSSDLYNSNSLDILTYNIWMPRHAANGATDRAKEIPAHLKPFDIVVLQEAFNDEFLGNIENNLASTHPYKTGVLNKPHNQDFQDDGGVAVLSRWPIVEKEAVKYTNCPCGSFIHSELKGVWYVKINKLGTFYHLFATHTTWNDGNNFNSSTGKQLQELKDFIQRKQIPSDQPVLIAGDLNIFEDGPGHSQLLQTLDARQPYLLNNYWLPHSHDGRLNTHVDDNETGTLDYILYSNDHLQPTRSYSKVIPMMSMQTNVRSSKYPILIGRYLSDHFAKQTHFEFTPPSSGHSDTSRPNGYYWEGNRLIPYY